jgi:hypothetical protein
MSCFQSRPTTELYPDQCGAFNLTSICDSILLVQSFDNIVESVLTMLTFIQIATPGHELYGNHLSQQNIDAMVAPKAESSDLVMQCINSEGLGAYASISPRSDSVIVKAGIYEAQVNVGFEENIVVKLGTVHCRLI